MADFFDNTEEESVSVPAENEEEGENTSLVTLELSDNTNKDVVKLRKEGYGVENNNDPDPENTR